LAKCLKCGEETDCFMGESVYGYRRHICAKCSLKWHDFIYADSKRSAGIHQTKETEKDKESWRRFWRKTFEEWLRIRDNWRIA